MSSIALAQADRNMAVSGCTVSIPGDPEIEAAINAELDRQMNRIELISLGLFPSLEPALPRCFKVFHVGTMAQRLATTGGIVPVTWPHSFPSPRSLAMGGC